MAGKHAGHQVARTTMGNQKYQKKSCPHCREGLEDGLEESTCWRYAQHTRISGLGWTPYSWSRTGQFSFARQSSGEKYWSVNCEQRDNI